MLKYHPCLPPLWVPFSRSIRLSFIDNLRLHYGFFSYFFFFFSFYLSLLPRLSTASPSFHDVSSLSSFSIYRRAYFKIMVEFCIVDLIDEEDHIREWWPEIFYFVRVRSYFNVINFLFLFFFTYFQSSNLVEVLTPYFHYYFIIISWIFAYKMGTFVWGYRSQAWVGAVGYSFKLITGRENVFAWSKFWTLNNATFKWSC